MFLFLLFACKDKPPVDEHKFMLVYIDLISFPDTLYNQPEMFEKFKEDVFAKYGIKKEDYKKMVEYYNSKPELWEQFFQKAIEYVEAKSDSSFLN